MSSAPTRSSSSLLRRHTGYSPAEDIGASFDSANSAPLAAFLTLDLQFRPFHHLALVVCLRVVRFPQSLYSMLRSQQTLRTPQATHGSQGRPQRSIWGVNRSWLSAVPRRATFLPFFVRLIQLPPRYPSYFYFGSVVRGFLVLILNRTPRLPLLPCHPMHATIGLSVRQRMMAFIFHRGDVDVRSRCAFVLISLCGPVIVHRCFIRTSFHSCVRFLSVRTFLRPFSQCYSVLLCPLPMRYVSL